MRSLVIAVAAIVSSTSFAQESATLRDVLRSHGGSLVHVASQAGEGNRKAVFRSYVRGVTKLVVESNPLLAKKLLALTSDPPSLKISVDELAWLTHVFAREFYRDDIIANTSALIRFKTFETNVPNRMNPEFIRQREFLLNLATKLGLQFNDVDGYIQEIWIGDGDESFGLMSHSDVQPVVTEEWSTDPWSGAVVDGKILGRGAMDDKGPIVAIMYGMRAILDSGIPLRKKIILLVGTDEESANEDVATYLKTNTAPDNTIVVDSNYPVICAEKGWCGAWLQFPSAEVTASNGGTIMVDLQSGYSPSIVPEFAVARFIVKGKPLSEAVTGLDQKRNAFLAKRPDARIAISTTKDTIVITARGKSVHSSVPATGHNALVDLLLFVDQEVDPLPNEFLHAARFVGKYIGWELDGRSLGIAHHDDFMGDVTVAVNMAGKTDTSATLMFNFRTPKGIEKSSIEKALNDRFLEFNKQNATTISPIVYLSDPLYNDPSSQFIAELLEIYNGVTGENRSAQSIGGGTYAKRIPNAVVFGPAMPDEEYTGHQPNEFLSIATLERNIEILTHTMVRFAF